MTNFDARVTELLLEASPPPAADARMSWNDVLHRAGRAGSQRQRRGLHVWRLAGVAAAAIAAFAVGLTAPWDRAASDGLADRALAAVGGGPVLHARLEVPTPGAAKLVDLGSGRETAVETERELWYDAEQGILHELYLFNGKIFDDSLITREGAVSTLAGGHLPSPRSRPTVGDELAGFVEHYREALENGKARIVSKGTIDGRAVLWLEFETRAQRDPLGYADDAPQVAMRAAVDAESYRPVLYREIINGRPSPETRVALIEMVSREDANLRSPKLEPRIDHHDVVETEQVSTSTAAEKLGRPAIWAGRGIGGLALTGIAIETLKLGYSDEGIESKTMTVLSLRYGSATGFGPHCHQRSNCLLVQETVEPLASEGKLPIPEGALWLRQPPALAYLKRSGSYVTIWASSEELALQAARALRPIVKSDTKVG